MRGVLAEEGVLARGAVLATTPNPFVMRLTVAARRPLIPGSGADLLRNHPLGLFADEKG